MSRGLPPRDRGQAHTLEAVIASLLLLTSVLFALQSTAVTPLSASTSSQHIENQQQETATGLLAAAAANGSLKKAILYRDSDGFHGAGELGYYTTAGPNVTFGQMLNRTFAARGIAYNVYFNYQDQQSDTNTQRFIYAGVPSDNAVSASWTVVLHDDDTLYFPDGTANETATLTNASFTVNDVSNSTDVYNVVRVEVVAWRV